MDQQEASTPRSPWEAALGGSVEALHPRIRAYVAGMPAGALGKGAGLFDVVGTPRRWLWPVLALLARQGVLAPAWCRDVPFTLGNRLTDAGILTAERELLLPRGPWSMCDAVSIVDGELVDDLGTAGRYRAVLHAWAEGGALRLRSTRVSVRLRRAQLPVPRLLAPVVLLREGFDDAAGLQRVHLRLEHPLLGVLYEYRGTFDYRIAPGPITERLWEEAP